MNKYVASTLVVCSLFLGVTNAGAEGFGVGDLVNQEQLDDVTAQLGFMMANRQYQSASPMGLLGFDVSVNLTGVSVSDSDLWDQLFEDGDAPGYLPVPTVHLRKGLPGSFDIGVRYTSVPGTDLVLSGGMVRYAILNGSLATPALTASAAYSKLSGAQDFSMTSSTVDLAVSKGFLFLTPYAGIAMDRTTLDLETDTLLLDDVTNNSTRTFAGVKFSFLPFVGLTVQADFGETQSYGLSLNVGI